ncbi:dihydroneopterin aldolase [Candidatus Hydrogenedentota bacterium]
MNSKHDIIRLTGLSFQASHGVEEWERQGFRQFEVDLEIFTDLAEAGATDSVDSTVDYSWAAREVSEVIEGETVSLLETLAEQIAARILTHRKCESVRVVVRKFDPPFPLACRTAEIEIVRDA